MADGDGGIKRRRGPSRPGGGKRKNRDRRKAARRAEAQARQAAYDTCMSEGRPDVSVQDDS